MLMFLMDSFAWMVRVDGFSMALWFCGSWLMVAVCVQSLLGASFDSLFVVDCLSCPVACPVANCLGSLVLDDAQDGEQKKRE